MDIPKSNILQFVPRAQFIVDKKAINLVEVNFDDLEAGVIEDTISNLRAEYTNADIEAIKADLEQEDEFED